MSKVEMDDASYCEVPLSAFNVSLRSKLSTMLNPELPFFERDGCARDYRGLAELMGFDNNAIMNFQRMKNPTSEILQAWERGHTVSDFIHILQSIQRYDVIDDLTSDIISACDKYFNYKSPIQVPEITSCDDDNFIQDHLTIYDSQSEEPVKFDAYVCYADSNIKFVRWLANHLESTNDNIKLCIRDRDLPYGVLEYDNFIRIVHERCRRILIVLSPEFLETPECEYQAKYAASLASEHRNRRLIPIVYKPCEIPPILKYISKVDFSRVDIQDWIWTKLIASIKTPSSKLFVPPANSSPSLQPDFTSIPSMPETSSSSSMQLPDLPSVPSDDIPLDTLSPCPEPMYPCLNIEREALVEEKNKSKGQKIVQRIKNFMGSSSSSSSASSGFHSQSDAINK